MVKQIRAAPDSLRRQEAFRHLLRRFAIMIVTRILAVPGSLRQGSFTTALLKASVLLAPVGTAVSLYEHLALVPPFNEDLEAGPAPLAVASFRRAIEAADGLLIATPEYNGSLPGQLKNALDWASRPAKRSVLEGKLVATLSASPSPRGGAAAQAELRRVLTRSGAQVVGHELIVPSAYQRFDDTGALIDPDLGSRLVDILIALVDASVEAVLPFAVNA